MAAHQIHHYVPAFLLKQWHSPPDDKLTQFTWIGKRLEYVLESKPYKARFVARQPHLYSTGRETDTPDTRAETTYLTPSIDEPGALVHQAILDNGIEALTIEQRTDWVRFLVAQMVRVPKKIHDIRTLTKQRAIANVEDKNGESMDEATATLPMLDDVGIKALPHVIESNILNSPFLRSSWGQIWLNRSSVDLLIGDNPLLLDGDLAGDFLVALPLTPRLLFLAYTEESIWRALIRQTRSNNSTNVAKMFNRETVEQAEKYVYSTGKGHEPLIQKYLKKPQPSNQ